MKLVVVESPTKSKTLQGFLGPGYKVLSSYGHIRDLPKGELGVDVEKDFEPKYVIPTKSRKTINLLKKEVEKASLTILATDEDREGEAIAWHLAQALKLNGKNSYQRIAFHEITKSAIKDALKNPRKIDMKLVNAQQARRVLDRIVGYKLSPFLWKKIARGLSAGRVQSIAVRLIVEREREIEKFKPEEYWNIIALLKKLKNGQFEASLIKKDDKVIPKLGIKTKEETDKIVKDLKDAQYKVENVEKKETRKNPLPPFTTSTLQQTAFRKFHWTGKQTMRMAQNLYERGLITYHRTDSLNLSSLALGTAKEFITKNYGQNYYQFRKYKAKGRVQEAHEAIRPTYADATPSSTDKEKLSNEQFRLYELIWQRFIASQMAPALFDATTIDVQAKDYIFRATGQIMKFDGFLKVYLIQLFEEAQLPDLKKDEVLELVSLSPKQHFTQAPARYSEASLIKALEAEGIGRPSTYAPIISTIQDRNYIEKNENRYFKPTEIGFVVNDLLVEHFPKIVDIKFTAKMENEFDEVAQGRIEWKKVIEEFYGPFSKNLEEKYEEVDKKEFTEKPTGKTCPKCSGPLLIRLGKFGKFYACSKFPKCRYTESLPENVLNIKCPKCKEGTLVAKRTKRNKIFYGCNRFPECDFALWDKPVNKICPQCSSLMVEKNKQIKCSNRECQSNLKK